MEESVPTLPVIHPVEIVAISTLRPHERNYRSHPEDQRGHIEASLREHGVYRNVVIARDGTILAGHGVVEAATHAGVLEVPVVRLDVDPDDPAAIKVLVGDNELEHLAVVDDRLLAEHLKALADMDVLFGTGYDEMMLANLAFVTRPASEVRTMDDAAHWVGLPEFANDNGDDIVLVLHFDDDAGRDALVTQLGLTISKKMRQTWSAYWPPREKQDLASLRFDG